MRSSDGIRTKLESLGEDGRGVLREALSMLDRAYWIERLGFNPFAWQVAVLRSKRKRKAILASRQSGKSTIVSGAVCHTAKYEPGSLSIVLAPTQQQAQDDMLKVKQFIGLDRTYPALVRDSDEMIELDNGSRINVVTATDKSARGKSKPRCIVLEEGSRIPELVYKSGVRPMLTDNPECELILISTPNGPQGYFFNAFESPKTKWERFLCVTPWRIDPEDDTRLVRDSRDGGTLMAQYLDKSWAGAWFSPRHRDRAEQEENLQEMGRLLYRQEYLCEFVEAQDSVFSADDIGKVFGDEVVGERYDESEGDGGDGKRDFTLNIREIEA